MKFALTLSQNLEMALIQQIAPPMRFMKMLADCRAFVFINTVEKGVELYSRHNLHRTDHIQNGKQRIAD